MATAKVAAHPIAFAVRQHETALAATQFQNHFKNRALMRLFNVSGGKKASQRLA